MNIKTAAEAIHKTAEIPTGSVEWPGSPDEKPSDWDYLDDQRRATRAAEWNSKRYYETIAPALYEAKKLKEAELNREEPKFSGKHPYSYDQTYDMSSDVTQKWMQQTIKSVTDGQYIPAYRMGLVLDTMERVPGSDWTTLAARRRELVRQNIINSFIAFDKDFFNGRDVGRVVDPQTKAQRSAKLHQFIYGKKNEGESWKARFAKFFPDESYDGVEQLFKKYGDVMFLPIDSDTATKYSTMKISSLAPVGRYTTQFKRPASYSVFNNFPHYYWDSEQRDLLKWYNYGNQLSAETLKRFDDDAPLFTRVTPLKDPDGKVSYVAKLLDDLNYDARDKNQNPEERFYAMQRYLSALRGVAAAYSNTPHSLGTGFGYGFNDGGSTRKYTTETLLHTADKVLPGIGSVITWGRDDDASRIEAQEILRHPEYDIFTKRMLLYNMDTPYAANLATSLDMPEQVVAAREGLLNIGAFSVQMAAGLKLASALHIPYFFNAASLPGKIASGTLTVAGDLIPVLPNTVATAKALWAMRNPENLDSAYASDIYGDAPEAAIYMGNLGPDAESLAWYIGSPFSKWFFGKLGGAAKTPGMRRIWTGANWVTDLGVPVALSYNKDKDARQATEDAVRREISTDPQLSVETLPVGKVAGEFAVGTDGKPIAGLYGEGTPVLNMNQSYVNQALALVTDSHTDPTKLTKAQRAQYEFGKAVLQEAAENYDYDVQALCSSRHMLYVTDESELTGDIDNMANWVIGRSTHLPVATLDNAKEFIQNGKEGVAESYLKSVNEQRNKQEYPQQYQSELFLGKLFTASQDQLAAIMADPGSSQKLALALSACSDTSLKKAFLAARDNDSSKQAFGTLLMLRDGLNSAKSSYTGNSGAFVRMVSQNINTQLDDILDGMTSADYGKIAAGAFAVFSDVNSDTNPMILASNAHALELCYERSPETAKAAIQGMSKSNPMALVYARTASGIVPGVGAKEPYKTGNLNRPGYEGLNIELDKAICTAAKDNPEFKIALQPAITMAVAVDCINNPDAITKTVKDSGIPGTDAILNKLDPYVQLLKTLKDQGYNDEVSTMAKGWVDKLPHLNPDDMNIILNEEAFNGDIVETVKTCGVVYGLRELSDDQLRKIGYTRESVNAITDKLVSNIKTRVFTEIKKDPYKNIPKMTGLAVKYGLGFDSVGEFIEENPIAFWLGAGILLFGGVALLTNLFSGNDDDKDDDDADIFERRRKKTVRTGFFRDLELD